MSDLIVVRARAGHATRSTTATAVAIGGRAYDPARLRRGAIRAVTKLGPHQYRVEGRHEKYYDVNLDIDTPCDCMDAQIRGRGCLHELAARLHDGDGPLIQSLGDMLLRAERIREKAGIE